MKALAFCSSKALLSKHLLNGNVSFFKDLITKWKQIAVQLWGRVTSPRFMRQSQLSPELQGSIQASPQCSLPKLLT